MKVVRRVASAIALGVLFVSGLRLSGHHVMPSQRGGWQPLELPDDDTWHDRVARSKGAA